MKRQLENYLAIVLIFSAFLCYFSASATQTNDKDGEDSDICIMKNEIVLAKINSVLQKCQSGGSGAQDELRNLSQVIKQTAEKFANLPVEAINKFAERAAKCAKAESLKLVELTTGKYYFNSNSSNRLNWRDAKNFCEKHGMQLLVIRSANEMEEVWNAAPAKLPYDDYWLGATDNTPGQFSWLDGRQIDRKWWLLGQPDRYGRGQNSCVYLHDAKLWDMECSLKNLFICRLTNNFCL